MKSVSRQLFFVLGTLVWCGPGWAGTDAGTAHVIRFRAMAWDSSIKDLNFYHGAKVVPMTLFPNGRSPFYTYKGPDPMLFFRQVKGDNGKLVPEVLGSIPLSEFKERTLLLFFSKPDDSKQYRVVTLDDSDAAIPPGGYRFINNSKAPLQVKCGSSEGDVAPDQSVTLQGNPADKGGITGMQVDAVMPDGKVRHAYSNMLPFGKANRTLVFIYQAPDTGELVVKRIVEDAAMLPKPSPTK